MRHGHGWVSWKGKQLEAGMNYKTVHKQLQVNIQAANVNKGSQSLHTAVQ
jgi:hypothetical protein